MHERTCPECGAAFSPHRGNQVCCSDACKRARAKRLDRESRSRGKSASINAVDAERIERMALAAEREEKASRRAAFFAARDAAFERAGLPIPKIVVRDGVRIENRGVVAGRPSGKSSLQISSKSYYYR